MLAVELLRPRPGDKILDACAAPGGKCCHIAEITKDGAIVTAADIKPHRLELMEQNIGRLGHRSIECVYMDAARHDVRLDGAMDKVLLDAPCSGFGAIGRKPEIKWNRSPRDVGAIAAVQSEMLTNAARYVKPGGALLYSVCTNEPEECECAVRCFLSEADGYCADDVNARLPPQLRDSDARDTNIGVHFYPNVHGIDGMYIARIIRKK
jgi:16S rRNA (cytosine967-C5)-methyltransferase